MRDTTMPIYGFHCENCGKEFETLVRSSETAACPGCESTKLSRQLSLIAKPASGGTSDSFGGCSSAADLPPCATGPCCGGGACSH